MLLQAWAQPAGVFHGSSLKVAVNDAGAVASVPFPITISFSRCWWDVEVTDKHGAEMVNRTLPAGEWHLSNPPGASVIQGDHNEVLHIPCGSLGEFWFKNPLNTTRRPSATELYERLSKNQVYALFAQPSTVCVCVCVCVFVACCQFIIAKICARLASGCGNPCPVSDTDIIHTTNGCAPTTMQKD